MMQDKMLEETISPINFRTYSFFFLAFALGGISLVLPSPFSSWCVGFGLFFFYLGTIELLNWLAPLFPKKLSRIIHWIHAMSFECIAVLFCFFCLRPLAYFPWKEEEKKEGTPILFLHGYFHNRSAWIYLRQKLREKGPLFSFNFTHPLKSIEEYARTVESYAKKIEEKTGKKELILIGHSMGGLVASWYALKLAPESKVSQLITIGSPFSGTYLAQIAPGPNGKEMRIGSLFTTELHNLLQKNTLANFYQIGTKTDQIVVPSSSSFTEIEAKRKFCLEDIGHLTLLFSPRVAHKISIWLES